MARPPAPDGDPAGPSSPDPLASIRHVVMVGVMGSGKTTVGTRLAARLGRPLRDSDADIEAATGLTVREIRERDGTAALHGIEAAHLLAALAAPGPDVVCAAASIADRDDCLAALTAPGIAAVWVVVPLDVAARRFASGPHRPSFGDDVAAFLERQMAERGPRFGSVARLVLDTGERAPEELADEIVAALGN